MRSPSPLTKPLLWLSKYPVVARLVPLVFVPAGVTLLTRSLGSVGIGPAAIALTPAEQLLSIALLLFCIELSWMAYVDLNNVRLISSHTNTCKAEQAEGSAADEQLEQSSLLNRFLGVLASTIVLETTGFYVALFSLLAGALLVVTSQIWFNLFSGVQLFPAQSHPIVLFGPRQRIDVLAANGVAFSSLCLWPAFSMELPAAICLLLLITLFLILKYAPLAYRKLRNYP